ncbi:MAG: hypothetical protein ACRD0K_18370 [Egibacteraceae bacterium]
MIPQLSGRPRTLVRAAHVVVSGGWLGLVVAMLVLAISAAATREPTLAMAGYALMGHVGNVAIPVFAAGTLLTGVALSVTTPWGLFQHYWVIVKLVLTFAVIVTGIGLTGQWVQQATAATTAAAATGVGGAGVVSAAWPLVAGSAAHLLMLGFAAVISVDKPWGKTPRGRRLATERAARGRHRTRGHREEAATRPLGRRTPAVPAATPAVRRRNETEPTDHRQRDLRLACSASPDLGERASAHALTAKDLT